MLTATCACARFPLAKTRPIPTASKLRVFNIRVTPPRVRRANSIPVSRSLLNFSTEPNQRVKRGGRKFGGRGGGRTHTKSELRQILSLGLIQVSSLLNLCAPT